MGGGGQAEVEGLLKSVIIPFSVVSPRVLYQPATLDLLSYANYRNLSSPHRVLTPRTALRTRAYIRARTRTYAM